MYIRWRKKRERKTSKRREEISVNFFFSGRLGQGGLILEERSRGRWFGSTDRSIGTDSSILESRNSRWSKIVPIDAPVTTARRPRFVFSSFLCFLLFASCFSIFRFFLIFCFSFIYIEIFFFKFPDGNLRARWTRGRSPM